MHLIVSLFLLLATSAVAAQAPRYALAYAWDSERHRAIAYRQKVASLLGLAIDRQLSIVGRDQVYGVVWNIEAPSAQARKVAEQQNAKLRRAGLKPAQVVASTSYSSLYNIRFAQSSHPDALQADYARLKKGLSPQSGEKLVIEKTDSRHYAIVYRCWESKGEALRLAKQHAGLLSGKSGSPALIAAVDRPAVEEISGSSGNLTGNRQGATGDVQPRIAQPTKEPTKAQGQSLRPEATAGLNTRVAALLQEEIRQGKIQPQMRTGWAAYDLTTNTYLVSVNLHRPFQAASMIKPFVALAFFHQAAKGKVSYTPQHRRMMEEMIQHSSNPATNWFIRQLGGPARCEALLKTEYASLVGQIRIKEYIPPDGRTYKNSIQPSGYIQFLRALWNYQLPNSKEMLRLMSLPGPDRLVYGSELPGNTEIYNKTGTTSFLCGDMGILVARAKDGRKVPYAVVGIVERPSRAADYKQWMHASGGVIRDFSSLVYEEMKRKHNLL